MTAVFVDTNVLVYARDLDVPAKQGAGSRMDGCPLVSAARVAGCDHILTEDLQPGSRMAGMLLVSPFERSPGEVLG